jgi:predicted Zn-dependent protease
MIRKLLLPLFLGIVFLSGCATNPVTGKTELAFISQEKEIQIGQQQYGPSRQLQGGDYRVEPELQQYISHVGQKLSAVSDRELPYEFRILNNSTPNAWALPGGKITVYRGLLTELQNEAELAAVLGHEMVHAAARHGAKAMERGLLLQGAMMASGIALSNSDYADFGMIGVQLGASLITQKYSRDAEREADLYGMEYMAEAGYDPYAAVTLQEFFVKLSENRNQDWLTGLFASHPPSRERIEANRKKALALGPGGILGAEKYQQMTAHLQETKNAYDAYDKGCKALSKGNPEEALNLAQTALDIEPKEALFHGLIGDVRYHQKQYHDALINYDRAVAHNPEFFHFYLQRGLTKQKLDNIQGAESDLKTSLTLLPTATAQKALGDIALADGNMQGAKLHYQKAAESTGESGKQALAALVRLDLPDNPNQYLQTRLGLSKHNYPLVRITNPTPVAIHNITYGVRLVSTAGRIRTLRQVYRGTLQPGQSVIVPLGLGPVSHANSLRNLAVGIIHAEVVR